MSFLGSITGSAETAEHTAIKYAFFGILPDSWVDVIQSWFRYFGLPPNPFSLPILLIPIFVLAIIGAIASLIIGTFKSGFRWFLRHWLYVIPILCLLGLIYWLIVNKIYPAIYGFTDMKNVESFVIKSSTKSMPAGDPDRITLVNIQPVCMKQAGYVGPTENRGTFKPDMSIMNAIRSGIRMFTLQIDYTETDLKTGFDKPYIPTLLYRDNSNELISTNGASISDIATNLSIYAFNSDFPTHTQPIVLYLHFVRTPDPIMEPTKFQTFMESVASALKPIQGNILTKIDNTDYTKQQAENMLIYTSLTRLENKIIVLTNANTSLLRALNLPSDKNLDYMTSMRVYLGKADDILGVTSMPAGGVTANALIFSYERLRSMTQAEQTRFAQENVDRFIIAMPGMMETPSEDDIQKLFTVCGVNVLPMNLFAESQSVMNTIIKPWGDTPFYKMKPNLLQSDRVAVLGYTPPPTL